MLLHILQCFHTGRHTSDAIATLENLFRHLSVDCVIIHHQNLCQHCLLLDILLLPLFLCLLLFSCKGCLRTQHQLFWNKIHQKLHQIRFFYRLCQTGVIAHFPQPLHRDSTGIICLQYQWRLFIQTAFLFPDTG